MNDQKPALTKREIQLQAEWKKLPKEEIENKIIREAQRRLKKNAVCLDGLPEAYKAFLKGEGLGTCADILVIDTAYWDGN